jgi:hypothetical protein
MLKGRDFYEMNVKRDWNTIHMNLIRRVNFCEGTFLSLFSLSGEAQKRTTGMFKPYEKRMFKSNKKSNYSAKRWRFITCEY